MHIFNVFFTLITITSVAWSAENLFNQQKLISTSLSWKEYAAPIISGNEIKENINNSIDWKKEEINLLKHFASVKDLKFSRINSCKKLIPQEIFIGNVVVGPELSSNVRIRFLENSKDFYAFLKILLEKDLKIEIRYNELNHLEISYNFYFDDDEKNEPFKKCLKYFYEWQMLPKSLLYGLKKYLLDSLQNLNPVFNNSSPSQRLEYRNTHLPNYNSIVFRFIEDKLFEKRIENIDKLFEFLYSSSFIKSEISSAPMDIDQYVIFLFDSFINLNDHRLSKPNFVPRIIQFSNQLWTEIKENNALITKRPYVIDKKSYPITLYTLWRLLNHNFLSKINILQFNNFIDCKQSSSMTYLHDHLKLTLARIQDSYFHQDIWQENNDCHPLFNLKKEGIENCLKALVFTNYDNEKKIAYDLLTRSTLKKYFALQHPVPDWISSLEGPIGLDFKLRDQVVRNMNRDVQMMVEKEKLKLKKENKKLQEENLQLSAKISQLEKKDNGAQTLSKSKISYIMEEENLNPSIEDQEKKSYNISVPQDSRNQVENMANGAIEPEVSNRLKRKNSPINNTY